LNCDIEAKDWCVLLSENTQHDSGGVNNCDRDARIIAERLSDRRTRNVCLLGRVRNDRSDVAGCERVGARRRSGDERKETRAHFATYATESLRNKLRSGWHTSWSKTKRRTGD